MVTAPDLRADAQTIHAHLQHITRRWHELGQDCLLELAFLSDEDSATVKHVAHYRPDQLADAAEDAAGMNQYKVNAYATVNPLDAHNRPGAGKRAKAEHIVASFFHWADADDKQAADNIRNLVAPRPTFFIMTGTKPCERPHVYWELQEPTRNLTAWTAIQRSIAARLQSDPAVVDPPRIMRLAGTVNWPKPSKREQGYIPEVTTLHIHSQEARPRVTSEQMARAFPAVTHTPSDTGFNIEANSYSGKDVAQYADILQRAKTDGQKHSGVRDLCASLAGSGVPQPLAEAIVRASCPVWDDNVQDLLSSAYSKFYTPPVVLAASEDGEASEWPTPLLDFDETRLPRRQWVYGNDYIRQYVSVVASAGGVGKTSQAIVEAMAIASGIPLLGVDVKEQCGAWVVNLEDPLVELEMRALAARKHYGVPIDRIRGKLFMDGEDTIQITLAAQGREGILRNDQMLEAMAAKIIEHDIGVVIFDPFVSTHLIDENSNSGVQAVVAMFRELARKTNASVCLVHHTRKGNGEYATVDSVRGAGSIIGAARAVRVVNRLSEKDIDAMGIEPKEAAYIFRVDDGKANLAPPADRAVFRKMVSVKIDNGEYIGVCTQYELPDEWAGMSEDIANEILRAIAKGPKRAEGHEGSEEYYSARAQDKGRWVGDVITSYPFPKAEDFKSEAQAKMILRQWFEAGILEVIEYRSEAQRKERKGVIVNSYVGENK